MTYLTLLLAVKIAITFLLVAAPFLALPKAKLEKAMNVASQSSMLFRLYGMAIFALLIGYAFGVPAAQSGHFPWGVTAMGAVSNGGAAFVLFFSGAAARNPALAGFFTVIAIGLAASMLFPEIALSRIF